MSSSHGSISFGSSISFSEPDSSSNEEAFDVEETKPTKRKRSSSPEDRKVKRKTEEDLPEVNNNVAQL